MVCLCLASCSDSPKTYYGSVIDTDGALDGQAIRMALHEQGRAQVRMEGEIAATCAKKDSSQGRRWVSPQQRSVRCVSREQVVRCLCR